MTSPLRNDRFLRALRRQPVDRTPVWLMRQAGRYLPEYRATRKAAGSFLAMAKNPELACEVTLQPLRRFPLDAAILFSDILTVPDAMGLGLYFVEGEGPKFERPVRNAADIARLGVPDMATDLRYVMDAVSTIRRELDGSVPLIGFSGSPWTLACYMVEGGGSKDFARVKSLALNDPAAMHRLLEVTTDAVIAYLSAQRAAGAQALQVFDTWGGVLSPAMYREFSLRYLTRIARELERGDGDGDARAPLILFGKGNGLHVADLAASGTDAVGVDWTIELGEAARRTGGRVALQGNLDPVTLYASPEAIRSEVGRALDSYRDGNGGSREGHVFNLGHGMSPDMDPDHVAVLVEAVHALSAR
ncbi:uroporphyrinogen decarboxylase [Lysobacter arseniciresistens ZS79]|uniref:Uroporphyrinogen decarboxylase n=1 Tax=Lysobacter arseniciresistens ZS79 TaxID=913325 RepID=A0A0A0F2U1_9GAMM|nr:uroporphyrinogen decarboxylase [Lysobacter arseniciresistens]KGM57446.1 uroporphyrinogen decarboxylase [Lysobacter arseniciresistens ZS79]